MDDLDTKGQVLRTHGAAFRHVVLRGRIDRLLINNDVLPSMFNGPDQKQLEILRFREANEDFYQRVDWALDISEAEFREIDIRGIPASLIRRDPETQIVVKRPRILREDWRELDFQSKMIPFMLGLMLQWESLDMVLIAPKLHPEFRARLKDLKLLQAAGISEPD